MVDYGTLRKIMHGWHVWALCDWRLRTDRLERVARRLRRRREFRERVAAT